MYHLVGFSANEVRVLDYILKQKAKYAGVFLTGNVSRFHFDFIKEKTRMSASEITDGFLGLQNRKIVKIVKVVDNYAIEGIFLMPRLIMRAHEIDLVKREICSKINEAFILLYVSCIPSYLKVLDGCAQAVSGIDQEEIFEIAGKLQSAGLIRVEKGKYVSCVEVSIQAKTDFLVGIREVMDESAMKLVDVDIVLARRQRRPSV